MSRNSVPSFRGGHPPTKPLNTGHVVTARILLSSHRGLRFPLTPSAPPFSIMKSPIPITYYQLLLLLRLPRHPDPSSLSVALEFQSYLASLKQAGEVLVLPRNKPVGCAQGIVAGSEKEMCPCVTEVTWTHVPSGCTRRWRVVGEERQAGETFLSYGFGKMSSAPAAFHK